MIGSPSVTFTACAERQQLHRNQPLIVIAGDDDVELAAGGAHEHRVARERTRDIDARRARHCVDRRRDRVDLLPPEQPVFAGVRVQARHGNARPRDTEARQLARRPARWFAAITSRVSARGTSASAMWTVASTTRSTSE